MYFWGVGECFFVFSFDLRFFVFLGFFCLFRIFLCILLGFFCVSFLVFLCVCLFSFVCVSLFFLCVCVFRFFCVCIFRLLFFVCASLDFYFFACASLDFFLCVCVCRGLQQYNILHNCSTKSFFFHWGGECKFKVTNAGLRQQTVSSFYSLVYINNHSLEEGHHL